MKRQGGAAAAYKARSLYRYVVRKSPWPRRCSRGRRKGEYKKSPDRASEHDGDKPTREREVSSTDGAVPVTSKFHLAHPHLWLARLKRALRFLCVRKPRRRRRPEDDRPVRSRPVPTGSLRRQGIRYGMHRRPSLFPAEAAVDAYNNKRKLHRGKEREKENNK